MCQRYVIPEQLVAEREFLPSVAWWRYTPRYNVALTQNVPAIRDYAQSSEAVMLRWGLIPAWVEGDAAAWQVASVRMGRVPQSEASADAWAAGRRCILPMAGFYVWHLTADNYRQPFFVQLRNRSVFGVAAVWDRWVSEEDDVIESCALITVPANELLSELSGPVPGMPAILRRRDYATWLQGPTGAALAALGTYRSDWMLTHAVSPRVNSTEVDDAELIRQVG